MNRTVLLPLAVIVLMTACEDKPAATAPAKPPSLALTAPDASAASTVCRAYKTELDRLSGQLAQTPADPVLRRKVDAYHRIFANACN